METPQSLKSVSYRAWAERRERSQDRGRTTFRFFLGGGVGQCWNLGLNQVVIFQACYYDRAGLTLQRESTGCSGDNKYMAI